MGEADLTISTLTDRYQTTVPKAVRERLNLSKRGKIAFREEGGRIFIENADAVEHNDPALAPFLDLLAEDMANTPQNLRPLDARRMADVRTLTHGVELGDTDAPLNPEDD